MVESNGHNETERLKTLRGYGLLDTPNEPVFDAIVEQARRALGVPIVLISLVDKNRQWFKARIGLNATETPRCISFCTHAIFGADILIVPDALVDTRFAASPLVTGAPNIRFYAGMPLKMPNGHRIGTLCAIDIRARHGLTDVQISKMHSLADQTITAVIRRSEQSSAHNGDRS